MLLQEETKIVAHITQFADGDWGCITNGKYFKLHFLIILKKSATKKKSLFIKATANKNS